MKVYLLIKGLVFTSPSNSFRSHVTRSTLLPFNTPWVSKPVRLYTDTHTHREQIEMTTCTIHKAHTCTCTRISYDSKEKVRCPKTDVANEGCMNTGIKLYLVQLN